MLGNFDGRRVLSVTLELSDGSEVRSVSVDFAEVETVCSIGEMSIDLNLSLQKFDILMPEVVQSEREERDPCGGWFHCNPYCCGPCLSCGGYGDCE